MCLKQTTINKKNIIQYFKSETNDNFFNFEESVITKLDLMTSRVTQVIVLHTLSSSPSS